MRTCRNVVIALAVGAIAFAPVASETLAKPQGHKASKKKRGKRLVSDTAANPSPIPFWGEVDCANDDRHQQLSTGGDTHPTALGAPQGDTAFRRLTVYDGDDFWGERCELGKNRQHGPTGQYREGTRYTTDLSVRLPEEFPLEVETWQAVAQMKQAGPAANSDGTPVLELDAYGGSWRLRQSDSPREASDSHELWSAPATRGVWTRFSFDVRYSRKASKGFIQVSADLNGDGDYSDASERSERIHTYTLKVEIPGGDSHDRIRPGHSIPSHLRAGLYHDEAVQCEHPDGCYVDIDNVQIVRAR